MGFILRVALGALVLGVIGSGSSAFARPLTPLRTIVESPCAAEPVKPRVPREIGGLVSDAYCCSSGIRDRVSCLEDRIESVKRVNEFLVVYVTRPICKQRGGFGFVCEPDPYSLGEWGTHISPDETIDEKTARLIEDVKDRLSRFRTLYDDYLEKIEALERN